MCGVYCHLSLRGGYEVALLYHVASFVQLFAV